jgi:hypothetical protein
MLADKLDRWHKRFSKEALETFYKPETICIENVDE